ncbi:MAG TPA: serine/threonine-protein kinase [Ktedonobacteraceae bacterium]|nr:serine/threonine-protein kinase [Ktedonobacteraceae bacterium]
MQDHFNIIISGRYRLLKHLRRGGMSEVFLAFDEQAQQQVAIKIVTNSDPDCIQRLQREVRILRKLSHQHILPLLDNGISDSHYYLVMPYMQKGNLRERLAQNKLTQEETGVILHQLLGALGYAHEQGIIHRDIKPSNILLDTTDAKHIYLADFGIAKILEERSDITQAGYLVGTPEYMAPELAETPESVSSDIYAMGVLLYQMLAGQLPFSGANALATYWKHIKEQPTPPSSLNPEISYAIEQVILCALNKDPRQRFPDARALSLAYANALSGVYQFPALATIPANDLPTLPPPQVTVRKMETGFSSALPAIFWRNRAGTAIQRSVLSLAALLLMALPVSLGFIFAHGNSQANQPLSINSTFSRGEITGKVLPAIPETVAMNGGGVVPARASIVSAPAQVYSNTSEGDEHGHGHEHKHGDDQPVGNNAVIMLNNVSTFGGSVSPLSSR